MKKIVIAIDGYSSCGKSTLAKQLAKELDYIFVDSGAMYRAITLFFLNNHTDIQDPSAIQGALDLITLNFKFNQFTGKSDIFLNGENVELQIREMRVNDQVSNVAALEAVRTFAVAQQQQMGQEKGIVMDGRDIGTTVFPDAELKIFVTADIDIRVQRRLLELREKNPSISEEEVKQNLQWRDQIDSSREVSPLRQATDAIVLDNSKLTREEQLAIVLGWANNKINN